MSHDFDVSIEPSGSIHNKLNTQDERFSHDNTTLNVSKADTSKSHINFDLVYTIGQEDTRKTFFIDSKFYSDFNISNLIKNFDKIKNLVQQNPFELKEQSAYDLKDGNTSYFAGQTTSDFRLGEDGNLHEQWAKTMTYPSQLIEVNKDFVILECLTDVASKQLEKRSFKRELFEKDVISKRKAVILVKTFERPGKAVIEFHDGSGRDYEKYFAADNDQIEDIDTGGLIK